MELHRKPGPLADASKTSLGVLVEVLAWLDAAFTKLQPMLEQADAVLALGGLATALIDGAATASAAMASLSKELVDDKPGDLLAKFQEAWPPLYGGFRSFESDATILPPPEDMEIARKAMARLLDPAPKGGARSLRTLGLPAGPTTPASPPALPGPRP